MRSKSKNFSVAPAAHLRAGLRPYARLGSLHRTLWMDVTAPRADGGRGGGLGRRRLGEAWACVTDSDGWKAVRMRLSTFFLFGPLAFDAGLTWLGDSLATPGNTMCPTWARVKQPRRALIAHFCCFYSFLQQETDRKSSGRRQSSRSGRGGGRGGSGRRGGGRGGGGRGRRTGQ